MFFYSEQVNIILSSSVSSISYPNTMMNSSSSASFILYGIQGSTNEQVILTINDSSSFSYSPNNFYLSNGLSQSVSVIFYPTTTGSKTATITASSQNGSVQYVGLQGLSFWSATTASGGTQTIILV